MALLGFDLVAAAIIPIIPVMLGEAALAKRMAECAAGRGHLRDRLLLPGGAARARRASARRCPPPTTDEHIDRAVAAFAKVGALGAIGGKKKEAI